jgi:cytochrome c
LTVALAVWAFCAYYSFMCRAAVPQQAAPGAAISVWNGVYTDEQAKRGEGLYLRECSSCHLEDLMGTEYTPPLTVDFFVSDWGLGALTVGDLFERIRTSMPKDKPGSVSRQEYADIIAHILKLNKVPAGQKELDEDAIVLKQIRMSAKPQH